MTDQIGSTETTSWYQHELAAEREYVAQLYGRLDELRDEKKRQLVRVQAQGLQGSMQNQSERDSFASLYQDRINQLNAVDERLVFGRLDTTADVVRHIGRIGLAAEDRSRLLVDWRAPEAAPFYQATAATPQGVARRRHLMMSGRTVESFEDDVLTSHDGDQASQALLSAVSAPAGSGLPWPLARRPARGARPFRRAPPRPDRGPAPGHHRAHPLPLGRP